MKIPVLDMKAQLAPIKEEIKEAVGKVIDSGAFILGEAVSNFERQAAEYCGINYAIGVSNGTDAITLTLKAFGIGKGDKVLCPAFTYYATAGAIAHAGAEPVFIDIDPKTYCISPDALRNFFKRHTTYDIRHTKAVIPVHLYGQCSEMDEILEIAKEYNLKVIEDTAQAFGASYKGRKAGTIGDSGTISFFPGKNLGACGDAGMVLTDNEDLTYKIRRFRNQGADQQDKYTHIFLGYNMRLDSIQAAVLSVKIRYIDEWNLKRAKLADYYTSNLKETNLKCPYVSDGNTHIYHQYILRACSNSERERIVASLQDIGIDARVYYPIPLHLQKCFEYLGYKKGDFPEAEKAAKEIFAIPVYPELTDEQREYVVRGVRESLK